MKRIVLLPVLALAACNSSTEGADPGAVTQEEAEALEDAASMLDEQRMASETPEPETSFETIYCSATCVKTHGAKAWADASRLWKENDDSYGYLIKATEGDPFWTVIESDKDLSTMMTSAGWEGPGDWTLTATGSGSSNDSSDCGECSYQDSVCLDDDYW